MRFFLISLLLTNIGNLYAQPMDSLVFESDRNPFNTTPHVPVKQTIPDLKPGVRTFIVPVSLVSYGVIAQLTPGLRELDSNIKTEVRKHDPDFRIHIDDYLQYSPGLSVFALNAIGIKGKHNIKDETLTYILTTVISGITVQSVKAISKVRRPDGIGSNAFPSGHTSTAFAGAEFLRQEYKDISPWYGIAGYTVATATGVLRIYNNKHWFRDVMAGAGFGILSTMLAYKLEPIIAKKIFHSERHTHFTPLSY
jgi:PAP2 superfamily